MKKLTHEDAVKNLIDRNILVEFAEKYKGRKVKTKFKCVCGNIFESTYVSILQGSQCGCKKEDFIGKRFGYITVLEKTNNSRYNRPLYLCKCDCGKEFLSGIQMLTSGDRVSCGCKRQYDLTNKRFGKLVALYIDSKPNGQPRWFCQCDCGRTHIVRSSDLLSNHTRSCGNCGFKVRGISVSLRQLELHRLLGRGVVNFKTKCGLYPDIAFVHNGRKIAIEYDEVYWHDEAKDLEKTKRLLKDGWKVIRILCSDVQPNEDMMAYIDNVIKTNCSYSRKIL